MIDSDRLNAAFLQARRDLLAERGDAGHWVGELSTSALSTATAVSALALVERPSQLGELIHAGADWLVRHQNADGGWGDTEKSYSNIATTMLAAASLHLAGQAGRHSDVLGRAQQYIDAQGGIAGLRRRYGKDKTFAVPILTNCALAGLAAWREVAPLPFELACLPRSFYRLARLQVVSYAIPALVAVGQARYFQRPPLNPITRLVRRAAVPRSLRVLEKMQPASGGYLEAVPLTSFVVMSLASTSRADHPVTRRGVEFLISLVRPDGSWPIDTNLATWNTTGAINALAGGGHDVAELDCLDWLLACQHRQVHPFTGAPAGGWGWSDASGAVPDADDTAGALLALAAWCNWPSCSEDDQRRIRTAARDGVKWLLDLQNADGGWPTFCRGWGALPFDRSGADLTAHAIRAIHVWKTAAQADRIERAIERGLAYLAHQQQTEGCWLPLWFGNQDHPNEENPVYGTSRVLLAYRDLGTISSPAAQRGLAWLKQAQNADGGWGGIPIRGEPPTDGGIHRSSTEETALAVEALLEAGHDPSLQTTTVKGLGWIVQAVEENRHLEYSPIGFYFAKLWYHERLYPLTFTVSALGQAQRRLHPRSERKPATSRLHHA